MNEKLILLLDISIGYLTAATHEGINDSSLCDIRNHIEELKNTRAALELAYGQGAAHNQGVSDRDELRKTMCHLNQAIQGLQVELVRATGDLRSILLFLSKLDLGNTENKINMKISELSGSLTQIKDASLKAFSEIRNRIDAADARILVLEKGLADADIPPEAETALTELKVISKQLDDIVPDTTELPPVVTPPTPV